MSLPTWSITTTSGCTAPWAISRRPTSLNGLEDVIFAGPTLVGAQIASSKKHALDASRLGRPRGRLRDARRRTTTNIGLGGG